MKISLEIVPRSEQEICETVDFVESHAHQVSAINIPDLPSFDIRAWEACSMIAKSPLDKIAHLRAIDFDMNNPFPLKNYFKENNFEGIIKRAMQKSKTRSEELAKLM